MKGVFGFFITVIIFGFFWWGGVSAPADQGTVAAGSGRVIHIAIEGAIGPGVSSYVVKNLERAEERPVAAVVLTLSTPGGLDTSMREIVQAILDSRTPVICYVAPQGARAASAGTYILMSCPVAAMAPGTTIGAATPVAIGGGGLPGAPTGGDKESGASGAKHKPDMSDKMLQDSAAYMRGLAKMRGRPVEAAEKFVREAASISDTEALAQKMIDVRASSMRDLLEKLEGRRVMMGNVPWVLHTADADVERAVPSWRDNFLAAISDPNIAYILLLVGIYGLIFEFSNPGFILPGIVGAASLIVAFYALQVLPVNYAGLALLLLGLALITAEAFAPSFGVLGLGGVATFVIGSIMLFDTPVPGFQVSRDLIGGLAAISSFLALLFVSFAVRAWRRPAVSGAEAMIGTAGEVIDWKDGRGRVQVHGEVWMATGEEKLSKGAKVCVTGRDGLILAVERLPKDGEYS